MTGNEFRLARRRAGWTQKQTAEKLEVSQPYLSLLESDERKVVGGVATRAVKLFGLSPANLPLDKNAAGLTDEKSLAAALGGLGYPGYSHLGEHRRRVNPAQVLLAALCHEDLDSRVTEALPWVVLNFPEMDWKWLLQEAKARDVQNRLGYVTELARKVTALRHNARRAGAQEVEAALERSRLAREDTLCRNSLSRAERQWLRNNRPEEAAHWNLLTDLAVEHLNYAR